MAVEARMGRAECAPEMGEVDEQVCSVESTDEGLEEPEREVIELNETEVDRIDESIDTWLHESVIGFHEDAKDWGHEIDTNPRIGNGCDRWRSAARPPAQSDNTQCTENGE